MAAILDHARVFAADSLFPKQALRLKENGIHTSWSDLRKELDGQNRTTAVMRSKNGETIHVRKSTKAESRQLKIYNALGVSHSPGRVVKYEV